MRQIYRLNTGKKKPKHWVCVEIIKIQEMGRKINMASRGDSLHVARGTKGNEEIF